MYPFEKKTFQGFLSGLFLLTFLGVAACGKSSDGGNIISGDIGESDIHDENVQSIIYEKQNPADAKNVNYTMTLAFLGEVDTDIKRMIYRYNASFPDSGIEILDMGHDETEKSASMTRLMADLTNGRGPDLLVMNYEQMNDYHAKGLLYPLDEFLSAETRNSIVPAVVEYGTFDDTLAGLAPCIREVRTCIIKKSYGVDSGWSIGDCLDIMEKHRELKRSFVTWSDKNNDRNEDWLSLRGAYGCETYSSRYIDFDKRKCNFDSPEFIHLLDRIYADYMYSQSGKGYSEDDYLAYICDDFSSSMLLSDYVQYSDGYDFVGFPTENDKGNYIVCYNFLTVNSKSESINKLDNFFEYLVSLDAQQSLNSQLSIRIDIAKHSLVNTDAEGICWYLHPRETPEYIALRGAKGVDRLVSMYESMMADCCPYRYNETIGKILDEEFDAFLYGDADAEKTAKMIQSRVQLYLDEEQ
ncbi:MAG: hypothetical protein ILP13_02275 [Lachnospiraceae bacterium]|nr:hypothetical protein [Lachnospiraceae bacterium]